MSKKSHVSTKISSKHMSEPLMEDLSSISENDIELADEPEVIEMTLADKKRAAKEKKPPSEAKLASIRKAQQIRTAQLKQKRDEEAEARKVIEKAYRAEVEASLSKTMLPKYEKSIKKQILEDLKRKKVA